MDREYDLVVVGTGVTSAVASHCREAGWTVAVVDRRPFGGTCALRGCVPKKILVSELMYAKGMDEEETAVWLDDVLAETGDTGSSTKKKTAVGVS